jgi:hypothetical protein
VTFIERLRANFIWGGGQAYDCESGELVLLQLQMPVIRKEGVVFNVIRILTIWNAKRDDEVSCCDMYCLPLNKDIKERNLVNMGGI